MTKIRAKFTCMSAEAVNVEHPDQGFRYRLHALYGDGSDNAAWSKATPHGDLHMTVTNPDAEFVVGKAYYLDFTAVEDEEAAKPVPDTTWKPQPMPTIDMTPGLPDPSLAPTAEADAHPVATLPAGFDPSKLDLDSPEGKEAEKNYVGAVVEPEQPDLPALAPAAPIDTTVEVKPTADVTPDPVPEAKPVADVTPAPTPGPIAETPDAPAPAKPDDVPTSAPKA